MRRSAVLLLTLGLALVTAVALLWASVVLAKPAGVPAPASSAAEKAVVASFYDAVNAALATGDPAPLDAVLAAGFVDHPAPAEAASDRRDLHRFLADLRATYRDPRLLVDDLRADGDRVMARVRLIGTTGGAFLGIPLAAAPPPWPLIDLFRLDRGRIAERWGFGAGPDRFHPLPAAITPDPAPAETTVELARWIFGAGARDVDRVDPGPALLAVEAGTLTVRVDGRASVIRVAGWDTRRSPAPLAPGTDVTLAPGDQLLLPTGTAHAARNDGAKPAVVFGVVLVPPWHGRSLFAESGVAVRTLSSGEATRLPSAPVVLALGRATLVPGAGLPAHAATGPEVIAVEAGTLELTRTGAQVRIGRQDGKQMHLAPGQAATLGPGDAACRLPGSVGRLRNVGDGSLTFWLLTVTPVGSGPSAASW